MISKKEIKSIMRQHLGEDQIEDKVIECIKTNAVEYVNYICKILADDYIEKNKFREKGNVRKMRRLKLCEYKNLLQTVNKTIEDFNVGIVGEINKNTTISKKQNIEVV